MKITFNTIKEIIIFNIHKTTMQNITKNEAISETPVLLWCNDILFNVTQITSDQLFLKQVNGIEYIDTITYVNSEKIEQSRWNGYTIEVRDMSGHSIYEPLTEFLKDDKNESW
ncbi:MAG: hypothetical protein HOK63_00390 [Thaumarchaeota archaeon]|jgi:hypothetical protein|nr:hypothetical protein [Nitrososphaerota archaeon]